MSEKRCCVVCSPQDIFTTACITTGLLIFLAAAIDFTTTHHPSFKRTLIADVPLIVGGILCLLETVPCWRRALGFGFLFGYSSILLGWAFGFGFVLLWDKNSGLNLGGIPTPSHPHSSLTSYQDEISITLTAVTSALIAMLAILKECLQLCGRSLCQLCLAQFSHLFLTVLATLSICYCIALTVFISSPDIERHSWIFGTLLEAPSDTDKSLNIMTTLMLIGAIASWLGLICQEGECRSCTPHILTFGLIIVVISHVLLVLCGIFGFNFISEWSIAPQQSVWIIFSISTVLLTLTTALHIAVHSPHHSTSEWELEDGIKGDDHLDSCVSSPATLRFPMAPPKRHHIEKL